MASIYLYIFRSLSAKVQRVVSISQILWGSKFYMSFWKSSLILRFATILAILPSYFALSSCRTPWVPNSSFNVASSISIFLHRLPSSALSTCKLPIFFSLSSFSFPASFLVVKLCSIYSLSSLILALTSTILISMSFSILRHLDSNRSIL